MCGKAQPEPLPVFSISPDHLPLLLALDNPASNIVGGIIPRFHDRGFVLVRLLLERM